jgi:hypothetical protein
MGVQGKVRFTKKYKTPLEVNVSDKKGARTYFWQRSEEILSTLDTADLSLIKNSKCCMWIGTMATRMSSCHGRGAPP